MMKRLDFEYRIQQTISDDDYEIIDYVYSNHPTFKEKSDSENIDRIAILYKNFGMPVIKGMVYMANQIKKLDIKIQKLELELEKYKKEKTELENGSFKIYINKGDK